jgi:hypothetical protein
MLKTAVFAPTPMAMIATATRVNSGVFNSERRAYLIAVAGTVPFSCSAKRRKVRSVRLQADRSSRSG